jgi:hypothetical protein
MMTAYQKIWQPNITQDTATRLPHGGNFFPEKIFGYLFNLVVFRRKTALFLGNTKFLPNLTTYLGTIHLTEDGTYPQLQTQPFFTLFKLIQQSNMVMKKNQNLDSMKKSSV